MGKSNAILIINVGSSSIKFAVFEENAKASAIVRGSFTIAENRARLKIQKADKEIEKVLSNKNLIKCLVYLVEWLRDNLALVIKAVGHRLVHGGRQYHLPTIITPLVLEQLKHSIDFAPEHLPKAIAAIFAMQTHYPNLPNIACFDTDFHWQMPEGCQTLPLPIDITIEGIRKYGFHGLSYEYIYGQLQKNYNDIAEKKIVIAHLGSGASMVAIKNGQSIDTTMGFTPAGGLIMSSRTGDIDPGVLIYLLKHYKYTAEQLNELLNHQSGMKGISGISGDMQVLMEERSNPQVQMAIDMFCYQAKKHLGALIAALGGVDILVFTGGIGEKAAVIRKAICSDMEYAGISLDNELNNKNDFTVSAEGARVIIHVMATDEEYTIAQHLIELI